MTDFTKSEALRKKSAISRILWIEDLEEDVLLAERILKKDGLVFTSQRVDTREDFTEALESFKPDLILSDHNLPQFNSHEAFSIYKSLGLTIPFILVTGMVSEEFAVSCLKLGMDDYVLKTNLGRLPSAILTSFEHREVENEKKSKADEIRSQNEKLAEAVRYRTQELANEKHFSESIIKSMPGIFQVISKGRFIGWNQNMENVLGYSSEELSQLNFFDIIADQDKEKAEQQIQKILQEGRATPELSILTKERREIFYYLNGFRAQIAGKDLIVITGQDISDLKNAQEALRLNKERLDLAFSSSGYAWWDWDITTGGMDTHPNRYIALGYVQTDVTPTTDWWGKLLHPEELEKVTKAMEDCLSGKTSIYDVQYRLKSKQGTWKWFHDLGKIVTRGEQGQPLRMIGTVNDISNSKLIEQELTEAKYNAESASRTKGQFLANMSHEIRTPLNAIIGLNHLALKTELTPKQIDYLKKVQSSSESLLGIVNDILDFSKIEAGKLKLEEVNFDLEEVFQKLADVITYKAHGKGLEIAFGIDSDVRSYLIGDPIRLEQILSNLCSNAVKFTDKGEVIVTAKLLEDSDERVKLQFKVTDSGIGMDKKQLSRLFEPFTQADDSISRKYGGTGLGLSILKQLVEMMEGTVWVKSEVGKGSSFYFTVWLKKQKQQRKIPALSLDVRKLRVLLVDDNQSALKILKEALEFFSFEVIAIDAGLQAVHFLKNNNHHQPVQLILMDWKMPEMDGLKAAEIIRNDEQLSGIPIIMMCTSYANEELYQKNEEFGLSGILIKPIRYSRLYDMIINAIDKKGNKKQHKEHKEVLRQEVSTLPGGRILLVEDNEINQQVASELLEGFGFKVEIANNGLEALNTIKTSGNPSCYDLVLMDLQMPVMGGYKATTEIRRLKNYKNLPIIAMTADAMGGVREKCLKVGMMDFITKPINPNQLLETVQKWITSDQENIQPPRPATPQLPALQLDGVDYADGLERMGGNASGYHDLLAKFLDEYKDFKKEIIDEHQSGDKKKVNRLIHTLKGTSGNLGMTDLHQACKVVEAGLAAKGKVKFEDLMIPLSHALDRVLDSLNKNLIADPGDHHFTQVSEAVPLLSTLQRLLKDQDPDAISVLKEIGTIKGFEKQISKLETVLRKYDFDAAMEVLDELNAEITNP